MLGPLTGVSINVVIQLLMAVKIAQGRNWARYLLAFFFLLAILDMAVGGICFPVVVQTDPALIYLTNMGLIVEYILLTLQFVALILLFHKESSNYFNRDADPSFAADR